MSLRSKLLILFITFTLVPLVLFGSIVFSRARNILQAIRIAQLDTIADLKKDKIETFFHEREADIRSAQDYYNIRRNLPVLSGHTKGMADPEYRKAKKMLDDQLKTFQMAAGYLDVMLMDTSGRVVYVSNPAHTATQLRRSFPDRKAFEEGRKGIYFTNVFINEAFGNQFEMYGIAPVQDLQGIFVGEVVIEIDMEHIYAFIRDTTGLGKTGEALIAKKEGGKALYLSPIKYDPNAALKKTVDLREKIAVPAIKAVQGESGSGITYDYHGEEVLAAWRYIPFLRWGLVAKIDASEVFAPIRQLKAVVISVELLMVLIGALAALAITRTIAGPIVSLQKGAEAIAAGDLSHRVGTAAQDEVGRLSRAVDAMTDAIDHRIRERTRELEVAVAERKEAEDILKLANAYNRSLLEASLDPLVTIDANGKITDVNLATEKVTGRSREELIGTDFSNYFTNPEKARAGYQQVFREGSVTDYALEIRRKDGHFTPVLYNAAVYRDEAGNVVGVFAAARDITERKRAEEKLKLANAYNRSLLEASLDPLVTIDANGKITDANNAAELATGVSRERLIGSDFSDYFTEPDKARQGYQKVFTEGFVRDYTLAIRHTSGRITHVLYNAVVYKDEAGKVQGVFAAARDITERKRAEDEIKKLNQELEAFAYSVSHDLRSPLRSIEGFSLALLEDYAGKLDDTGKSYLSRVRNATVRMGHLIDDLLKLSRVTRSEMNREQVDLSMIVRTIADDLKNRHPERPAQFIVAEGLTAYCDERLLTVAMENLLSNAWKFSEKAPRTVIEFGATEKNGTRSFFVKDNGTGFDMNYAGKLFNPFQRLHRTEEFPGTGIGLATVKRIINRHGGQVWIEAAEGKGTTVYFTLG